MTNRIQPPDFPETTDEQFASLGGSMPTPGLLQGTALPDILDALMSHTGDEKQHMEFAEFFRFAATAYPEHELTDDAILRNAATPHLMRYLVKAMRNYTARVGKAPTTTKRMAVLADALGLVGDNQRQEKAAKWSVLRKGAYLAAFSHAASRAEAAGKTQREAYDIGVQAAYNEYREGKMGTPNGAEYQRVISRLKKLLGEHNYKAPPSSRAPR